MLELEADRRTLQRLAYRVTLDQLRRRWHVASFTAVTEAGQCRICSEQGLPGRGDTMSAIVDIYDT